MSAEISNALVEIQRMTKQYKAFQEAENALKVLVGHEQNVKELTDRVAELKVTESQLVDELVAAHIEVDAAKVQANKITTDAKVKASNLIAKAEAEIVQRREEADLNLNTTANALAGLEEQFKNVSADVEAKKVELDALENRINEARATLAKFASI